MRRRKREERDRRMREAARPDDRTLRVLARLEATTHRYGRAVERVEEKVREIGFRIDDDLGNRGAKE